MLGLAQGILTVADVVAQHNDLIGFSLFASGLAGLPETFGATLPMIGAGLTMVSKAGDTAANNTHVAIQKMLADLKEAKAQIGDLQTWCDGRFWAAGG